MLSCSTPPGVPVLEVEVLATTPHDPTAFTQGLEIADGVLYEATGLLGRSGLRVVDPETGTVERRVELADNEFGEGITVVGPTIWQLTWQNGQAIRRDRTTLAELGRASYEGEGWGLCLRGDRLVMSDGTDRLTFRDPETFARTGEVTVRWPGHEVSALNELECVGGHVWANVWHSDRILRIDPESGLVTALVDAAGLAGGQRGLGGEVLNGIAAVPGTDEFLITGKLWPNVFRVRFVPG